MNGLLLVKVGLTAAYGIVAIGFWRRGQRDAAIGGTLLFASSNLDQIQGLPVAKWLSLALLVAAVAVFWRVFGRARAAGLAG